MQDDSSSKRWRVICPPSGGPRASPVRQIIICRHSRRCSKKISECLYSLEEQPNLHQRNHVPILILPRILNAPPNLLLRSGWTYAAERACLRRHPGLTQVISSESCIPSPAYFLLAHFWRSIFGPTARHW